MGCDNKKAQTQTRSIREAVITVGVMASCLDCRVQSCMSYPERTVYYHFEKMQKKRIYKDETGEYEIKLLSKIGKGDEKYFVLSRKIADSGMLYQYELQEYYERLNCDKNQKNEASKRKSKKLSLAVTVMDASGILTFPKYKCLPQINEIKNDWMRSYFYTSREIKFMVEHSTYSTGENLIQYGQHDGFLITPEKNFIVYVIDKWLYRFNGEAERKAQRIGSRFFSKLIKSPSDRFLEAIYILRNENMFGKILLRNAPDGKHKKYVTGGRFDKEYFIPLYKVSEILPLILKKNFKHTVREKFFKNVKTERTYDYRDYFDGYLNKKTVILFTFDCEMKHIERALIYAQKMTDVKCMVFSFDWQAPYLAEAYRSENIRIKSIGYDKFIENMES